MQNAMNIEPLLRYIELADPRELWKAVFGAAPEFSDIDEGEGSDAACAMEEVLRSLSHEVRSENVGCPVECGPAPLGEYGLDLLRRKLMSAVILHQTSSQCLQDVSIKPRSIRDVFAPGVVAVIADPKEMPPVLASLGAEDGVVQDLFRFGGGGQRLSAICLGHGQPEVRIHLRSKAELQVICDRMIEETVSSLLTGRKDVFDPDIFVAGEMTCLPAALRFGDDDERVRLNAILEFVGDRIDQDGGELENILKSAPFRRLLSQKLQARISDYLLEVLKRYGFVLTGGCMSVRFDHPESALPVMYRLLGDSEDDLEGILMHDLISHIQVVLPGFPEVGPEIVVLPPVEGILSYYWENQGGADVCIPLRFNAKKIPDEADFGKIMPVVASTRVALEKVAEETKKIFRNDIISRGNS